MAVPLLLKETVKKRVKKFKQPQSNQKISVKVINFEMPQSAAGYVDQIGRTGRAYNTGASISLVSPKENDMFEDIKSIIGESDNMDSNFIAPFPLLTKNAVEGLRYRVKGVNLNLRVANALDGKELLCYVKRVSDFIRVTGIRFTIVTAYWVGEVASVAV